MRSTLVREKAFSLLLVIAVAFAFCAQVKAEDMVLRGRSAFAFASGKREVARSKTVTTTVTQQPVTKTEVKPEVKKAESKTVTKSTETCANGSCSTTTVTTAIRTSDEYKGFPRIRSLFRGRESRSTASCSSGSCR